jgi:hypothetical protein
MRIARPWHEARRPILLKNRQGPGSPKVAAETLALSPYGRCFSLPCSSLPLPGACVAAAGLPAAGFVGAG